MISRVQNQSDKKGQLKERNKAINGEVDKLVEEGIVRESVFPTWVENLVLVKKEDNQWRMCVNFTKLNKACPKDYYLLPSINER